MQQTTNLGLKKIQGTDDWRNLIDTYYNDSMDTIDGKMGAIPANSSVQGQLDSHTQAINELTASKGAASGIATLDSGGKVPASQLPSYVDDIESYAASSGFPATGEDGKIYVAKDTNKSYRWNGSGYTELSTYDVATTSAAGLMSATDKTKLDGVATGATANVVSDSLSDTSTTNALSAAKGKALNDSITELNSNLSSINQVLAKCMQRIWTYYKNEAWGGSHTVSSDCAAILFVNAFGGQADQNGIYLISFTANASNTVIKAASGTIVTVSNHTVTVSTTINYVSVNMYIL